MDVSYKGTTSTDVVYNSDGSKTLSITKPDGTTLTQTITADGDIIAYYEDGTTSQTHDDGNGTQTVIYYDENGNELERFIQYTNEWGQTVQNSTLEDGTQISIVDYYYGYDYYATYPNGTSEYATFDSEGNLNYLQTQTNLEDGGNITTEQYSWGSSSTTTRKPDGSYSIDYY